VHTLLTDRQTEKHVHEKHFFQQNSAQKSIHGNYHTMIVLSTRKYWRETGRPRTN